MIKSIINELCCPVCKGKLIWHIYSECCDRVVSADVKCNSCFKEFTVRDTIADFLVSDTQNFLEEDNYFTQKNVMSTLSTEVIQQLLCANPHRLNASDLTYLADVYLAQGKIRNSVKLKMLARKKKYSKEYNCVITEQIHKLNEYIDDDTKFILDIATGRGTLLKTFLPSEKRQVVGSDISKEALIKLKQELELSKLYDNVCLIVMNAKMIPFKENFFDITTSFHGLNHIRNTADLLKEVMRVSSRFVLIEHLGKERGPKNHLNGIKHTEQTITEIANSYKYNININNKKELLIEPVPQGDIVPLKINTYPKESCSVVNCIIDINKKSKRRKMLEWKYKEHTVFYYPELDGDGTNQAKSFVEYIDKYYSDRRFDCAFEWCSGPAFIGFSLLFEGICNNLCLADVNPVAIECVKKTIEYNHLEDKVVCYVSNNFKSIPECEKFDLVISNPPNYYSINADHYDYEWLNKDLRPNDYQWNIHRDFYSNVYKYLLPGAVLLIEEVEPFKKYVHIPITDDVPFDIRPNAPINDFISMIERGGLQYISAEHFHTDKQEGIEMWLIVSQKK